MGFRGYPAVTHRGTLPKLMGEPRPSRLKLVQGVVSGASALLLCAASPLLILVMRLAPRVTAVSMASKGLAQQRRAQPRPREPPRHAEPPSVGLRGKERYLAVTGTTAVPPVQR